MKQNVHISTYLDQRRMKANGKYPVKLTVFCDYPKKQKMYRTKFDMEAAEYKKIIKGDRLSIQQKDVRSELQAFEQKAIEIAKELDPFTFEEFENLFSLKRSTKSDVFYWYEVKINELTSAKRLGSASSYNDSQRSIKHYLWYRKYGIDTPFADQEFDIPLRFEQIDSKWLTSYEDYMLNILDRSYTTIGIYLRSLRAIYKRAISKKIVKESFYPFLSDNYKIPSTSKVNKALTRKELSILYRSTPSNKQQAKAKAFWFFSFACNGMNIKDIALLKYKNLKTDRISFIRAKTRESKKDNIIPTEVILTDIARETISKYANSDKSAGNYIFPILDTTMSEDMKHRSIKNFTKFINQHIKKLAQNNGITDKISTYWARHSFANSSVNVGASTEFVSEALGHSDVKITQKYIQGLETEKKKAIMNKVTDL